MKRFLSAVMAGALSLSVAPILGTSRASAVDFVPFSAAEVQVGYDGTCALSDGSVFCWGLNDYLQAGDPTVSTHYVHKPIKVVSTAEFANENVSIVSAGEYNHCAVENGSIFCWGLNNFDVLGNGTSDDAPTPSKVHANDGFTNTAVTAMETSDSTSCATEDGVLYCWGYNFDGQLGIGSAGDHQSLPRKVSPAGNFHNTAVTAFDVGRRQVCALEGGKMFCWGWNEYGQLGTGNTDDASTPMEVQSNVASGFVNEDITTMATAEFSSCAVRHGNAFCWGFNQYWGLIGTGDLIDTPLPLAVHPNQGFTNTAVTSIMIHEFTACALENGSVYCWGENMSGQLGTDNTTDSPLPMKVLANGEFKNESVAVLAVGDSTVCAIEAHRLFCTGDTSDDYLDESSFWASYTEVMSPVWGELSPRNATIDTGALGYTEWDQTIYDQGLPQKVRKLTSIKMLYPFQTESLTLISATPSVCLAAQDQVLFLKVGQCRVRVKQKDSGDVLFTRSTTVTKLSINQLGVGNPVAQVKKVMFNWETKSPRNMDVAEWARVKDNLSFTRIAFVVGYTHTGNGPKTSKAFSKSRAALVKRKLTQPGVSLAPYGLGSSNPIARGPSQKKQMKNERVVVYMIGTHVQHPPM